MLQTNWNRRETGLVALIVATTSILLFAGFVGVPPASGARLHPQLVRVAGSMKGDFLGLSLPRRQRLAEERRRRFAGSAQLGVASGHDRGGRGRWIRGDRSNQRAH
jgi:hypothetical protein